MLGAYKNKYLPLTYITCLLRMVVSYEFSPSVFFIPESRMKEQPLFGHASLVAEEKSERADRDMQWFLKKSALLTTVKSKSHGQAWAQD